MHRSDATALLVLILANACFDPATASPPDDGTSTDGPAPATSTSAASDATARPDDDDDLESGDSTGLGTDASTSTDAGTTADTSTSTGAGPLGSSSSEDGGDASSTDAPIDASRVVFLLVDAGAPMQYGGVVGADALCQAAADDAGLPGTFLAWLSATATTSPAVRFAHEGGPFVRTDGVVVADDWDDLVDGDLTATISVTADGTTIQADAYPEHEVITHTNADGTFAGGLAPCLGYTADLMIEPERGSASAIDASWTEGDGDGWSCNVAGPSLYCFAQ